MKKHIILLATLVMNFGIIGAEKTNRISKLVLINAVNRLGLEPVLKCIEQHDFDRKPYIQNNEVVEIAEKFCIDYDCSKNEDTKLSRLIFPKLPKNFKAKKPEDAFKLDDNTKCWYIEDGKVLYVLSSYFTKNEVLTMLRKLEYIN